MFQDRILIIEADNNAWIEFIKTIQRKLKELYPDLNLGKTGVNKDGVDGVLGDLTRKAILRFQLDNGAGPKAKGFPGKWTASKMGIQYVPKPDVSINKTDKTQQGKDETQNCSKFQFFPSVRGTSSTICKGNKTVPEKGPEGCSEYVRQKTGKWQGNAWHAYKKGGYPQLSGFKSLFSNSKNLDQLATVFQKINSQSRGMDQSGTFDTIKSLESSYIPSQQSFKNLGVGDVVGIYYPSSQHHGEAFFQAATGLSSDGSQVTSGPYFLVSDNGQNWRKWSQSDLGKNLKVKPGKALQSGDHFGFNTHLGFVGAKKPNGEPIIYHNVNGTVLATPLSDMGGKFNIMWGRPA
jgi:hypothetical protein